MSTIGSQGPANTGGGISIQDFDPVYRKQDFNKIRQDVLMMLEIDPHELCGTRDRGLRRGMSHKQRILNQVRTRHRLQQRQMLQDVHDQDQIDFALEAQRESQKSKIIQQEVKAEE